MKSLITCILLLFLAAPTLSAQFSLQVDAGASLAKPHATGPELLNIRPETGYGAYLAITPEYRLNDRFTLGLEGMLTANVNNSSVLGIIKYRNSSFYLTPLVDVRLTNKLHAIGGVSGSYLIYERYQFEPDSWRKIDLSTYKNFDAGILLGLRYQLLERLSISGRYYRGVVDSYDLMFTDDNGIPIPDGQVNRYHQFFQAGLGYRFMSK